MSYYKHRFTKGITIEVIGDTKKGHKVIQTERYEPWGDELLKKPKTKQQFYSSDEITELFEPCSIHDM
jgi:hypothetical protein